MHRQNGTLRYIGVNGLFQTNGYYIEIDHEGGYVTSYLHMKEAVSSLTVPDKVRRGDLIGWSNNTGGSTGDHLHFAVRQGRTFLDPVQFLVSEVLIDMPVRMRPVEAIVAAVDGTVPSWDAEIVVRYTAERAENGDETHTFKFDEASRREIYEKSKNVEWCP